MAIDKLTLFELHFDGAQFGPRSLGGEADGEATEVGTDEAAEIDSPEMEDAADGGPRFLALAIGSTLVAVVATLLARRLFGDDGQTTVDEFAEEPVEDDEAIEVEGDEATA